ncbi:hypothetical protein [Streptomyces sp. NPDC001020]
MSSRGVMDRLHGPTAAGVPRWAVWTAYTTAFTALPSAVWRITCMVFGAPLIDPPSQGNDAGRGPELFDGWWYMVLLSVVSEALAYLAVGLVCTWGEVFPRWLPRLGGRRVPVLGAVIPSTLGAIALTALLGPCTLTMCALGRSINGEPSPMNMHGWQHVAFWVSYTPLGLWGPLLAVLTVHYYRRRQRPAAQGHRMRTASVPPGAVS